MLESEEEMEKKRKNICVELTFQEIIELHKMVQESIKNHDYGFAPAISILFSGEDYLIIKACCVHAITKEIMKAKEEKREPDCLKPYKDITDKEKFEYI